MTSSPAFPDPLASAPLAGGESSQMRQTAATGMFAALGQGGFVKGVGIDIVDIARFGTVLERTEALAERLFSPDELMIDGRRRPIASLAARFAAKEAAGKALCVPEVSSWLDVEIMTQPNGAPVLRVTGVLAQAAHHSGVSHWKVSLTHDAGIAMALVVALG